MSLAEKFKNKENRKYIWLIASLIIINVFIILITLLVYSGKRNWQDWGGAGNYLLNQVYLNNFLKQPALVLGFLTLIGYIIMGRGAKDSILGALKTVIGYILLSIGSGTLVGTSKVVFGEISKIGGITITPLDPYFGQQSAETWLNGFNAGQGYAALITYVFVVAFAVNIVLVALKRWTNVHSLMITGHVMIQQSAIFTTALYVILFGSIPLIGNNEIPGELQAGLIVIGGLFLGSYWGIGSNATLKPTNALTGGADFAIGHQQMLGIATAYKISKYFGNKEDSAENKKMPKSLKIFEDNVFVQTLIITLLFLILIIILITVKPTQYIDWQTGQFIGGLKDWNNVFKGSYWLINVFGGALQIVAALLAMITGVRMFVTELQQSFQGISEKLIPGAVVAIDIAAVYGFSPNSVTFGFVSGTIGQFIAMGVLLGLSAIPGSIVVVVVPLFVTLFFNSGAIGPYANASGGIRAAIIVPALMGFIEVIVIGFGLAAIQNASNGLPTSLNKGPFETGYIGMSDWNLFYGLLWIVSGYSQYAAYILVPIAFLGFISYAQLYDSGKQKKLTYMQKLFKLKPQLITTNNENVESVEELKEHLSDEENE